jgi:hypothetical protein
MSIQPPAAGGLVVQLQELVQNERSLLPLTLTTVNTKNVMTKKTMVFVEIGMVCGIILAALMVPRSTPLSAFVVISMAFLIAGNILLIKKARRVSVAETATKDDFWPRICKILAICTIYWLLCLLLWRM